jgi:hypothetical protein
MIGALFFEEMFPVPVGDGGDNRKKEVFTYSTSGMARGGPNERRAIRASAAKEIQIFDIN